jgi:aerobic-type carbon monoxide dehydrogenase small subunit (CoxS/CutS family)
MIASSRHPITLTVNGRRYEREVEARKLLADFLREDLGLVGTHVGCEHGVCGACTVLLDGQSIRSCIAFAVQADGGSIQTVESLATGADLHPLQAAFWQQQGLQCGYCTPGMLLRSLELLREHPNPDRDQVREHLASNLCRCTGYQFIVDAVMDGAARMRSAGAPPAAPTAAGGSSR